MKSTFERFEYLKNLDIHAKSDAERNKIEVELDCLAKEDPQGFEKAVIESANRALGAAKRLRVKEQLSVILDIISMSYIAKTYFNKTKSWMSQRINEHNVNGIPAQFTSEEIDILNFAIKDISHKIGTVQIVMK